MEDEIKKVISYAEVVASSWNGDDAGILEDRAHIATEIIDKCNEVLVLLKELNETH